MTREEALARLHEIKTGKPESPFQDAEGQHIEADNVLMELLRSLGYEDVVEAYDEIPKWYA